MAGTGTYEKQVGTYVCSGRMCWFTIQLHFDNANHTGTGNLTITGLPFTSDDTTDAQVIFPVWDTQSTAEFVGIAVMEPDSTSIGALFEYDGTQVSIEADHELHITGVYRVDT